MRVGGILATTQATWIGFSDIANEGVWTWTDNNGIFPGTISWATDEPNGGRKENCAFMRLRSGKFVLIDQMCSTALHYVCEQEFTQILSFID